MSRVVTQVACNTTTGIQVITLPAGALANDPKAFQFWLVPGTANGTPVDHAMIGYGVAAVEGVGFTQYSVTVRSRHARNPSETRRATESGACVLLLSIGSSIQAQASIVSANKDEIEIQWTTAPAAGYLLIVEAIDCVAATVAHFEFPGGTSPGNSVTVTTGFEFDLLYVATMGREIPDNRAGVYFSWGVATYIEEVIDQMAYGQAIAHSVSPTSSGAIITTDNISCGVLDTTGAIMQAVQAQNVTATGFDLVTTVTTSHYPSDADGFCLALKFEDDQPVAIGTTVLPGSPDASFEIDVGMSATSFEALTTTLAAIDTGAADGTAGSFGIGFWDGTRQYSAAVADEDGATTSNSESVAGENVIRVRQHNGTTGIIATVDGVVGDDVVLDITSALARAVMWTALGVPASGTVQAAFSGTPLSGDAPLEVTFTDESIEDGTTITDWLWSFGDGEESTEQNPVHTYAQAAVYTVSLTVNSETASHMLTKTDYITATEPAAPAPGTVGVPTLVSAAMPLIPRNDVLASVQL